MKVLNLRCAHEHRFEGWFKSDDEVHAQLADGRLVCPLCGDADIVRLPSAPHVLVPGSARPPGGGEAVSGAAGGAAGKGRNPEAAVDAAGSGLVDSRPESAVARQAAWLQRLRRVIESTDDVGDRFAAEARRMHYGEAEERAIRGRATKEEARALVDEGIDVVALPTPDALKATLQ